MIRIAVLCSGGGSNLQALLDACDAGLIRGTVSLVLSNRKSAFALERAAQRNIPAHFVSKKAAGSDEAFDLAVTRHLQEENIDLVVLAGYLAILGPRMLDAYQGRILNIHPSLLPAFGGMGMHGHHVHEAVLAYGAKVSGATVHYVTGEVDKGPIVMQRSVEVLPDDTPDSLAARVLTVEHQILPASVALHCAHKISITGNKVIYQ